MKIGRKLHSRMTFVVAFALLLGMVSSQSLLLAETPAEKQEAASQLSPPQFATLPMKFVVGDRNVPADQLSHATGDVSLIHKGKVVGRYPIGPGGVAQIPKPASGVYAITTRSLDGIGMASTYIPEEPQWNGDWSVYFSLIPAKDFQSAESLVIRAFNSSKGTPSLGEIVDYEDLRKIPVNGGDVLRDSEGVVRIRLLHLLGEAWKARTLPNLDVYLIQDGNIVAYHVTDQEGYLETSRLKPGRYSMVVTGFRTQLMTSIYVSDRPAGKLLETTVSTVQDFVLGTVPVSLNLDETEADATAGGLVDEENSETANQESGIGQGGLEGMAGAPGGGAMGGSGFGGSGGGGGGVGTGGGLMSALAAGLAGAALGLALDDDNQVASPASPVIIVSPSP